MMTRKPARGRRPSSTAQGAGGLQALEPLVDREKVFEVVRHRGVVGRRSGGPEQGDIRTVELLIINSLEISHELRGGLDACQVGRGRAADEAQGQ